MAASGRHVPADQHRGDNGRAHGGAGGERRRRRCRFDRGAGPQAVRQATLADRKSASAILGLRHARRLPGPPRRTTSRRRPEQSAVIVVTPIEPARGPADDLVPVRGDPPFQPVEEIELHGSSEEAFQFVELTVDGRRRPVGAPPGPAPSSSR